MDGDGSFLGCYEGYSKALDMLTWCLGNARVFIYHLACSNDTQLLHFSGSSDRRCGAEGAALLPYC
jgi:hypothetical protein